MNKQKHQTDHTGTRASAYADNLRTRATLAELALCRVLDAEQISYVFQSFMWDAGTGRIYIADFRIKRVPPGRPKDVARRRWVVDRRRLFVEVDGRSHIGREVYDAARKAWMQEHRNAIVIRVSNEDVVERPAGVLEEIERYHPSRKTVRMSYTSPWYMPKVSALQHHAGAPRLVKNPQMS